MNNYINHKSPVFKKEFSVNSDVYNSEHGHCPGAHLAMRPVRPVSAGLFFI